MIQTQMATKTEVEGDTAVLVPPAVAEGLAQEQSGEKQTASVLPEEGKTDQTPVESATPQDEGTETEEAQPTRKERRIGEFVDKLKDKDREISALRTELDNMKSPSAPTPSQAGFQPQGFGTPPWEVPQVQPGSELTPEQLNSYVGNAARNLTAVELNRFKADLAKVDNFKDDLRYVEGKYDVLNPDKSDAYNRKFSKKIADLYSDASKGNPSLRLKDFVDNVMSFRQEGRNEGMMEVTPKVLKNQGEGAIPPSQPSGRRSDQTDPANMTYEEQEQWLKDNGYWDK